MDVFYSKKVSARLQPQGNPFFFMESYLPCGFIDYMIRFQGIILYRTFT